MSVAFPCRFDGAGRQKLSSAAVGGDMLLVERLRARNAGGDRCKTNFAINDGGDDFGFAVESHGIAHCERQDHTAIAGNTDIETFHRKWLSSIKIVRAYAITVAVAQAIDAIKMSMTLRIDCFYFTISAIPVK
jgi:hypothetical protein